MQRAFPWLLILSAVALAQPELPKPGIFPGQENRVSDDIAQAVKLAGNKNWDEAIRKFQQILADSGDVLVPVEPSRSLPARWVIHQRIAQLDPAARKLFRERNEETAARWLEQGKKERDWRLLEQVVAEAFCTKASAQALSLLGDLAFERGEFDAAGRYWRMLARPASQVEEAVEPDQFRLVHPDPDGDPALTRAKQILAMLFSGARDAAALEFAAFRKRHANAAGPFAGKSGKYADVLQEFLAEKSSAAAMVNAAKDAAWTTFAGGASRNRLIDAGRSPYWPPMPHWQVKLPGDPKAKPHKDADPPLGTGAASRALAFHPLVVDGHVLVADAVRVFAYDVITGNPVSEYDLRKTNGVPKSLDLRLPSRTDVRYTLSASGNRIYARFGAQTMQASTEKDLAANDTWIVCLELKRDAKGLQLRYRWQIRGRRLDSDVPALFEGAPLVIAGRLYVARTRFDGRQMITSIDCFDADSPDGRAEPPTLRWSVDVWNVEAFGSNDSVRHRHDLLTSAGANIVFCSHSGAVVAVDALTGKLTWGVRYPVVIKSNIDGAQPRDLNPAVYESGRLYVAPADCDRMFCFDAATGAKIWESSPLQLVHLVGVSNRRLFVTLGGYPHGIRAYDSLNGNPLWTKPDEGDRLAFGRGFLTDQWVFWPTREGLKVLRQEDGEPVDAGSSSLPLGNLAVGEGCLIAASATELAGFVPDRYRLGEYRNQVEQRPDDALAQLRFAMAMIDAGNSDTAIPTLKKIEYMESASEFFRGQPVIAIARTLRHQLLIRSAERSWALDERETAIEQLRDATKEPFAPADRIRAAALLHAIGEPIPPALLEDPAMKNAWVTESNGLPVSARELLLRWHGQPAPRTSLESRDEGPVLDWPMPAWPSRWERDWAQPLAARVEKALRPLDGPYAITNEGRCFFSRGREIVCRWIEGGKTAWSSAIAHEPNAFAIHADTMIVAGPGGVSRLRQQDGAVLWEVTLPDPRPLPDRFPERRRPELFQPNITTNFSGFRVGGTKIFFLHGPRLLAADIETGRVLWQQWAPGAPLSHASFLPDYLATHDAVLIQTSSGQLRLLDARSGTIRFRRQTATSPWTSPPILANHRHAVVPFEAERLVCLDLTDGRTVWEKRLSGVTSLSGSLPQLRRDGSNFVLVVERNYGYEWERRRLDTGDRDLGPVFLGREHVNLASTAFVVAAYCFPDSRRLSAFDRDLGRRLWTAPLPARAEWMCTASRNALVVRPRSPLPMADGEQVYRLLEGNLTGLPSIARYHAAGNLLYHAFMGRRWPVLSIDGATGKIVDSLEFTATGPYAWWLAGPRTAAVSFDGSLIGLKGK